MQSKMRECNSGTLHGSKDSISSNNINRELSIKKDLSVKEYDRK
jgi:hypothetical protein